MKSDIEIARSIELRKIKELASEFGIDKEYVTHYGRHMAKVDISLIDEEKVKNGNLILVTAITPTKAGIGKTTVSVGLALGMNKIGKKAILALREPSLGPCFGMKGGAAGGGYAQVLPMEKINLHFTGDFHAITSANNMISALLDNYIYQKYYRNEESLCLTERGEEAYTFFKSRIPFSIRERIDSAIGRVKFDEIADPNAVRAEVVLAAEGQYMAKCSINENKVPIMELSLNMGKKNHAERVAKYFRENADEIYEEILRICFKEND